MVKLHFLFLHLIIVNVFFWPMSFNQLRKTLRKNEIMMWGKFPIHIWWGWPLERPESHFLRHLKRLATLNLQWSHFWKCRSTFSEIARLRNLWLPGLVHLNPLYAYIRVFSTGLYCVQRFQNIYFRHLLRVLSSSRQCQAPILNSYKTDHIHS